MEVSNNGSDHRLHTAQPTTSQLHPRPPRLSWVHVDGGTLTQQSWSLCPALMSRSMTVRRYGARGLKAVGRRPEPPPRVSQLPLQICRPVEVRQLLGLRTTCPACRSGSICSRCASARVLLNGTRYGVHRVTVGEDEKWGRVRRHGEHDQRLPRNGRRPGVGSVFTVTVADGGDRLAQSRFRTVCYQHNLAPSPAKT